MSADGFDAARTDLLRARAVGDAARAAAAAAAERSRALAAQLAQFDRTVDPNDEHAAEERKRLAAEAAAAEGAAAAATADALRAQEASDAALASFVQFTDPRANVERLPDRSPFVLLPVRIETRFVRGAPGIAAEQDALLVRVYPDDCWIDTFEPVLSTTELANAQRYWRGIWRAGGVEADERAAWRGLVAAHGSGRAGWIVDEYQPVNLADRPTKANASDEILVISTQTPLPAAEAAAAATYWQAVWLADDDRAKQQAAHAALVAAVGGARADAIVRDYRPYDLDDTPADPLKKTDVALSTSFVVFPPDPATKQAPWSQAPKVSLFPERFVVLGYQDGAVAVEAVGGVVSTPLYVGPDPSVGESETIHPDGADLFVPDELKWMVDFERAVEVGMGIRIPLTPAQAEAGFDRLLVLGLTLAASDADGKSALEELLGHHATGRAGLTLVPQGTPTHNTTGAAAGYTRLDDADQSFDDRRNAPLFTETADPNEKRDGQWVAEALGVDPALFQRIHAAGGRDQLQARAMQRALWPATVGYWMDKMLAPVFGDDTVELTRWYFTSHVRGRGSVPAIRIGGQPYGILPTTAFSRIAWLSGQRGEFFDPQLGFLARLLGLLREFDPDWQAMTAEASFVGKAGDAHQILLDVVGLHPASVEFHSRYAESLDELFNTINLWGFGPDWWQAILALALEQAGAALLGRYGYSGSTEPDVLKHVFMNDAGQIANVVDDRPLSETDPVRVYTTDGHNYLEWLAAAAGTSLDALVAEEGFVGDVAPQALLYLFLRHALMLGYYDASYDLHRSAGFLTSAELLAMKPEPTFVHVADTAVAPVSESRFSALYKTEPRITSSPDLLVSDYITANLTLLQETAGLDDQIAAVKTLVDASTAQLERAFAEHVDVCSHRFDAWLLGIVEYQLQAMRTLRQDGEGDGGGTGVYLGAYAWVEDLRPEPVQLQPVQLPADLQGDLGGDPPLVADPRNGGFVHAPSLPHARTAAILRSGYLANATADNPDTMAVNLSSDRVRLALGLLEGIRNGQSLGALLGYRFERGLHDAHGLAEVDKFIYPLRKAFPLVADGLTPTKTPPDVSIEAIEARNVLDGRKLVNRIRETGNAVYPFGVPDLPDASDDERTAIGLEVDRLLDVYDAVADLALAEGVHQAAQGNFDRVAATLDAYTTGNFPPEPEVVQTPAPGIGLTHRVALHLRPGLAAPPNATPRAAAEPAVDDWLAGMLPDLADVACLVGWTDPVTGAPHERAVTLADLGVRPIDVLELVKPDAVQSMTELDDRILRQVVDTVGPRPDAALQIRYLQAPAGKITIFELAPLVRSLKTLVSRSRPLRATDALLQRDAAPEVDADVFVDRARIETPKGVLDTLGTDVLSFLNTLKPLTDDPVAHRAALVAGIDTFLSQAIALLERCARFNLPQSGWGFAYAWKHEAYVDLFAQVQALLLRWHDKLLDFDRKIDAYDALPAGTSDDDRFKALHAAELVVSTALDPAPATPAALRAALVGKRTLFADRRSAFELAVSTAGASFATTLAAVRALLPVDQFDVEPFDLAPFEDRAVLLAQDLVRMLTGQHAQIEARSQNAQSQLDAEQAAASAGAKADALQAGARALLGDDFRIVPEFGLSAAQGDEWANAVTAGPTLLDWLTTTAKVDFPVDEWLTGAARVRDPLRAWETAVTLAGGFGRAEPELVPMQLPFAANASWLALQFPPDARLDSDRLLYTAHYAAPFDKTKRQVGLLLDEWTETIPGTTRSTGIAFNFDRPDNEPPQAILLVTPASVSGVWQWDDLVGALGETLDLAKKRAVEPVFVDGTPYSRFLPATIMAATVYGITIATVLAAANGVSRFLEVRHA